MNKEIKETEEKLCYNYLLIHHQGLCFQLERQYFTLVNAIMYQCIIREHFKEAFSQQTLVALVRAGMCEVNQTILIKRARKYCHCTVDLAKRDKRKLAESEKKMAKAQFPTSEAM